MYKKNLSKQIRWTILLCLLLVDVQAQPLQLWYKQPAAKWTEALPIGNGSLGAMIFGGIEEDHLQFNESTLWSGKPRTYARPGAWRYLDTIRQLLNQGKQKEAEDLAGEHFMGLKDPDEKEYDSLKTAWLQTAGADTSFAAFNYNDSQWKTMQVPTPEGWERIGFEGLDGLVWMRNSFELPAKWQSKNLTIDLGRIRDLDITYINGIRIGSMLSTTDRRRYTIPANILKAGKNVIAIQVINYYNKGGLIGVKNNSATLCVFADNNTTDTVALSPNWKYFIKDKTPPDYPQYEASYQPFGDLYFNYSNAANTTNYRRELNIQNAVATTSYTSNGIQFKREYFSSKPDSVIVIHLTASQPGSISVNAVFKTPHADFTIQKLRNGTVSLYTKVKGGALYGVAYLTVKTIGGKTVVGDTSIAITNATEATFYLTAATNFKNFKDVSGNPDLICKQTQDKLFKKTYAAIKAAHIKDYQTLFNRYSITLTNPISSTSFPAPVRAPKNRNALKHSSSSVAPPLGELRGLLPTDERIKQFTPQADPELLALYQQYGRYLLISSSRPGGQPANLQGIWNDLLTPPWGSKYTTNINLQMNYWPAEPLNLSECAAPLWPLLSDLSVAGALTAKEHYNAPGWVLHHNTDLWRGTAPINASNHGIWQTGGGWLSQHIWEHYLFTQDKSFLQKYYFILKGAAEFFTANLVRDSATGYLISSPSNSPEHGGLVAGPTMDHQIIRQLFKDCIAACQVLQTDNDFAQQIQTILPQIAPNKIGKHGQLQEWMPDIDDPRDNHRHVSHLWGVYPGMDITWKDEKLMQAAKQSLLYRGDGGTGWSLAWKANLWSRFKDGGHVMNVLKSLLSPAVSATGVEQGGVYPNLFDAHPPFQIDGNFGGAAAIAEMLVQSQGDTIELLPALPNELPNGSVKGVCARGGFVIDINWKSSKLHSVTVTSKAGLVCKVKYRNNTKVFATKKGSIYKMNGGLQ